VYLFAVQYGADGLAWGWLVAFPILLAFTIYQARPHIGFTLAGLAGSVLPGLTAAIAMAATVWATDKALLAAVWPQVPALIHLAVLVAVGGLSYVAMMWFGARQTFMEVINLLVRRKTPAPVTP
jgi:Polysaccharide biosynthesis C-terminal domain